MNVNFEININEVYLAHVLGLVPFMQGSVALVLFKKGRNKALPLPLDQNFTGRCSRPGGSPRLARTVQVSAHQTSQKLNNATQQEIALKDIRANQKRGTCLALLNEFSPL